MYWEEYYFPASAQEAVYILQEFKGEARLIAGGTDLMLQLREKKQKIKALVDMRNISELQFIREEEGWIKIGSLTTHQQLASSDLLRDHAKVLAEAAQSIGSPQIRNIATIGGNVVNAQPAADTSIALLALNAQARILTAQGEVVKPVSDLFRGPGQSAVDATKEIVISFEFPVPGENESTAFERHAQRRALALPILNVGVWVRLDDSKRKFEDVRIAVGPMAPVPFRAANAEKELKGSSLTSVALKKAGETAVSEVNPRDSLRGSAAYRRQMVKVFLRRALLRAVHDLGGELDG